MKAENKYYKCWKCGESISETEGAFCTQPMLFRTSGICGGSTTNEITKSEYDTLIQKWDVDNGKSALRDSENM